jgi:predicted PurR-regulated permease PerM
MTRKTQIIEASSYAIMAVAISVALIEGLFAALIAGMLTYLLVIKFSPKLGSRMNEGGKARAVIVGIIGTSIIGVLSLAIWGMISFFTGETGSPQALLQRLADIIDSSRSQCPTWVCTHLPAGAEELRSTLTTWIREHSSEAKLIGGDAGHTFIRVLIGMIIGAMISLQSKSIHTAPLANALKNRIATLSNSFEKVVFAQVKISMVNTIATAIYLLVILPMADIHPPLAKTMIALTFILGLMPIIGNLISNSMIVLITLPFGLPAAIGSLIFLIVLHKFEYFLNAKIIGTKIQSNAWELLIAALVMESLFGITGVIAAPILYAYIKQELKDRDLV